jgi:hypothetical protein
MRPPSIGKAKGKSVPPSLGLGSKKAAKLPTNVTPAPPPAAAAGPPTLASGGPGAPSASTNPGGPVPPMGFKKGGKVKKPFPFQKKR